MKKKYKFLILIVFILCCYMITSTVAANYYLRLNKQADVALIEITNPNGDKVQIEKEVALEEVASCWQNQFLWGVMWYHESAENCKIITFYDEAGRCIRQYTYNLDKCTIYPGGVHMPQETYRIMSKY